MEFTGFLLWLVGLVAGFIDSIAGGGGLITVPVFSMVLGPGADAIGTNKIVGVISSGVALLVYLKNGHVSLRGNRRFAAFAAIGAVIGAFISPSIPANAYKWLIVAIAPVMLWIVYRKDLWVQAAAREHLAPPSMIALWICGFGCGLYDGIAGPGGGTLMFLSLLLVARLPLLASMATAKVANLATASVALGTFAYTGHVHWDKGLWMGFGIAAGASIGASLALKNAAPFARGALLVVTTLLIVRLALFA